VSEDRSTIDTYTIGFTKTNARAFFITLQESNVTRLLDVRLNNVSQLAGFAKRDDLKYFLEVICGIEFLHVEEFAPTKDILDAYKKHKGDWQVYESEFMNLMAKRGIESKVPRELLENACLLCSEATPENCHRRLVVEYLQPFWGPMTMNHLIPSE